MKIRHANNNYCIICGALISDTNYSGIGCGCKERIQDATFKLLNEQPIDVKGKYYGIKTGVRIEWLNEYLKRHTIRNKFYKDFIPSVISFWNEHGYTSKKQSELVERFCNDRFDDISISWFEEKTGKQEMDFISQFQDEHFQEIKEYALRIMGAENRK